jgi:hypothetical protein
MDQSGPAMVQVDDYHITQEMIDATTRYFPPQQLESSKKNGQFDRLLDQMAMGEVFYHKALDEKLQDDPAVKAVIAMRDREALANEWVYREAQKRITPEAVQKYYDDRKAQYAKPQIQARHILVKEEAQANDLKKQLDAGANFEELAKQYSTDKSNAANGGDLGWFNEGTMVKEFNDAAFAAPKGALVGPVQTRFGYHIILVEDKRDATPLEEVRPQIEAALRQESIDAIRKETKDAMKVTKNVPDVTPAAQAGPAGGMSPHGPGMGGPPGVRPGGMPPGMPPGAHPPIRVTPPGSAPPPPARPAVPPAPPAAPPGN